MTSNNEQDKVSREEVACEAGLATRFIHAGMWLTTVRILNRLFYFVRIVILARLLEPKDFGLFGLCLVAIQAMKVLTKSGFWAALLQKRGDVRPYLDTYFVISAGRGAVLTMLLFAGAGMTSVLLGQPEAAPLLRVICLCFLAQGLTSPAIVHYWRDLRLGKECIYQIVGTISDLIVAVGAAIMLGNSWALVLGLLARDIVQSAFSYILAPYRVGGWGSLFRAKELFTFGGWIFVTSVLMFLLDHGTMLFVGRILGVSALGLYILACQIGSRPAREFISVLANPTFVAFSTLQNDLPKLRQAYLKTLQLISVIAIPASVALAILAENIVSVFLSDKWASIVGVLMVLGLWSGLQSVNITAYALFKALGRPGAETRFRLWQILAVIATIWPLCRVFGLLGVGVALFWSELLISPLLWRKLREIIGLRLWLQFRLILLPAVASLCMAAMISAGAVWFNDSSSIVHLTALIAIGSLAYIVCILTMEFLFDYGAVKLIRQCIAGALVRSTLNKN
jgi:O-antigen/teichoic acid export membrane protein